MVNFSKLLGGSFLLGGIGFLSLSPYMKTYLFEWVLWSNYSILIEFSLLMDFSSLLFSSTVFLISGSVLIYCSWYMDDEIFYKRFIFLVVLFVSSMLCLIFIPNLVCLLIGWDGLGITSFLLVVFYQNNKSLGAGMVTALVNRIGDVLLLVSISILFIEGSWLLYKNSVVYGPSLLSLTLMIGAITKSAQMPFSAWLPAAMAAPTPVSSLVHSSTLVTAGVYLLYRAEFVLFEDLNTLYLLKLLSLVTLVMAGSSALVETDLKKVIALSTLSQLSMMLFSLSMKLFSVSFFHLVSHASFKALLFLCAGVVIHSNKKFQDIRFLGQSWGALPVSMSCFVVASMSLCGVPFFSGFYSKDMMIEVSMLGNDSVLIYFLLVLGTLFTSLYSFRVMLSLLFGLSNESLSCVVSTEKTELKWSYSALLLSSIIIGWVISSFWEMLCFSISLSFSDKVMPSSFLFVGGLVFYLVTTVDLNLWSNKIWWFLSSMWGLKWLTTQAPSKVGMIACNFVISTLEKGWLEKMGPQGSFEVLAGFSSQKQIYQQYPFLKMILLSVVITLLLAISFCFV